MLELPPLQMVAVFGVTVTVGFWFTVIVVVIVFVQLAAFIPVTVYVVVTDGFAITEDDVEAFNPDTGFHV